MQKNLPLHASTKDRNAKTESTRTGRSGSRMPATTQCNAFRKLFWSEKLTNAYWPATQAAYIAGPRCIDEQFKVRKKIKRLNIVTFLEKLTTFALRWPTRLVNSGKTCCTNMRSSSDL